jgi:hypothetical protein
VLLILLAPALADPPQVDNSSKNKEINTSVVGQIIKGAIYQVDSYRNFHLINVPSLDKKYLFLSISFDQIYSHLNFSLLIYKQGAQTPL